MRTIKFRAWHKKDNVLWIPVLIEFRGENSAVFAYNGVTGEELDKPVPHYPNECELMQFTGLLDKNGKEIYEGDVVIGETSYEMDCDNYVWTRERPAYVNWIEADAGFYPFTLGSRWRCDVCNIEVIGNIYENPELLNK